MANLIPNFLGKFRRRGKGEVFSTMKSFRRPCKRWVKRLKVWHDKGNEYLGELAHICANWTWCVTVLFWTFWLGWLTGWRRFSELTETKASELWADQECRPRLMEKWVAQYYRPFPRVQEVFLVATDNGGGDYTDYYKYNDIIHQDGSTETNNFQGLLHSDGAKDRPFTRYHDVALAAGIDEIFKIHNDVTLKVQGEDGEYRDPALVFNYLSLRQHKLAQELRSESSELIPVGVNPEQENPWDHLFVPDKFRLNSKNDPTGNSVVQPLEPTDSGRAPRVVDATLIEPDTSIELFNKNSYSSLCIRDHIGACQEISVRRFFSDPNLPHSERNRQMGWELGNEATKVSKILSTTFPDGTYVDPILRNNMMFGYKWWNDTTSSVVNDAAATDATADPASDSSNNSTNLRRDLREINPWELDSPDILNQLATTNLRRDLREINPWELDSPDILNQRRLGSVKKSVFAASLNIRYYMDANKEKKVREWEAEWLIRMEEFIKGLNDRQSPQNAFRQKIEITSTSTTTLPPQSIIDLASGNQLVVNALGETSILLNSSLADSLQAAADAQAASKTSGTGAAETSNTAAQTSSNTVTHTSAPVVPFKIYFRAQRSYDDEMLRVVSQDIGLIFIAIAIMICFTSRMLGRSLSPKLLTNPRYRGMFLSTWRIQLIGSRFGISTCAVAMNCMSTCAAYGACLTFGVPFVSLHIILPFILLGIGLDDVFIVIDAFDCCSHIKDIFDRSRAALTGCGMTVTVTTFTNIVAFVLGSYFPYKAVSYFCIYAAVGIFFNYLANIMLLISLLSRDHYAKEWELREGFCPLPFCNFNTIPLAHEVKKLNEILRAMSRDRSLQDEEDRLITMQAAEARLMGSLTLGSQMEDQDEELVAGMMADLESRRQDIAASVHAKSLKLAKMRKKYDDDYGKDYSHCANRGSDDDYGNNGYGKDYGHHNGVHVCSDYNVNKSISQYSDISLDFGKSGKLLPDEDNQAHARMFTLGISNGFPGNFPRGEVHNKGKPFSKGSKGNGKNKPRVESAWECTEHATEHAKQDEKASSSKTNSKSKVENPNSKTKATSTDRKSKVSFSQEEQEQGEHRQEGQEKGEQEGQEEGEHWQEFEDDNQPDSLQFEEATELELSSQFSRYHGSHYPTGGADEEDNWEQGGAQDHCEQEPSGSEFVYYYEDSSEQILLDNCENGNHENDETDANFENDETDGNFENDETDGDHENDETGGNHENDETDGNFENDTNDEIEVDPDRSATASEYDRLNEGCHSVGLPRVTRNDLNSSGNFKSPGALPTRGLKMGKPGSKPNMPEKSMDFLSVLQNKHQDRNFSRRVFEVSNLVKEERHEEREDGGRNSRKSNKRSSIILPTRQSMVGKLGRGVGDLGRATQRGVGGAVRGVKKAGTMTAGGVKSAGKQLKRAGQSGVNNIARTTVHLQNGLQNGMTKSVKVGKISVTKGRSSVVNRINAMGGIGGAAANVAKRLTGGGGEKSDTSTPEKDGKYEDGRTSRRGRESRKKEINSEKKASLLYPPHMESMVSTGDQKTRLIAMPFGRTGNAKRTGEAILQMDPNANLRHLQDDKPRFQPLGAVNQYKFTVVGDQKETEDDAEKFMTKVDSDLGEDAFPGAYFLFVEPVDHKLRVYIREYYAPLITSNIYVKLCIITFFLALSAFSLTCITKVSTNFSPIDVLPDVSYLRDYEAVKSELWGEDYGRHWLSIHYRNEDQHLMLEEMEEHEEQVQNLEYITSGVIKSWFKDFRKFWKERHGAMPDGSNDGKLGTIKYMRKRCKANDAYFFGSEVMAFLEDRRYRKWKADIIFSNERYKFSPESTISFVRHRVLYSRIHFLHHPSINDGGLKGVEAMKEIWSWCDSLRNYSGSSDSRGGRLRPEATAFMYLYWYQVMTIKDELIWNYIVGLIAILLVTMILVTEFAGILILLFAILMIDINLTGSIYLWGLELNSISVINLILSIGLVIDYSLHIVHAFYNCDPQLHRKFEAQIKRRSEANRLRVLQDLENQEIVEGQEEETQQEGVHYARAQYALADLNDQEGTLCDHAKDDDVVGGREYCTDKDAQGDQDTENYGQYTHAENYRDYTDVENYDQYTDAANCGRYADVENYDYYTASSDPAENCGSEYDQRSAGKSTWHDASKYAQRESEQVDVQHPVDSPQSEGTHRDAYNVEENHEENDCVQKHHSVVRIVSPESSSSIHEASIKESPSESDYPWWNDFQQKPVHDRKPGNDSQQNDPGRDRNPMHASQNERSENEHSENDIEQKQAGQDSIMSTNKSSGETYKIQRISNILIALVHVFQDCLRFIRFSRGRKAKDSDHITGKLLKLHAIHSRGENPSILRVRAALVEMGPNVLIGGITTFLGVVILILASSFVFRVFFKMFIGILVLGLSHALILVPVLLTFVKVPEDYPELLWSSSDEGGSSDEEDDKDDDKPFTISKTNNSQDRQENWGDENMNSSLVKKVGSKDFGILKRGPSRFERDTKKFSLTEEDILQQIQEGRIGEYQVGGYQNASLRSINSSVTAFVSKNVSFFERDVPSNTDKLNADKMEKKEETVSSGVGKMKGAGKTSLKGSMKGKDGNKSGILKVAFDGFSKVKGSQGMMSLKGSKGIVSSSSSSGLEGNMGKEGTIGIMSLADSVSLKGIWKGRGPDGSMILKGKGKRLSESPDGSLTSKGLFKGSFTFKGIGPQGSLLLKGKDGSLCLKGKGTDGSLVLKGMSPKDSMMLKGMYFNGSMSASPKGKHASATSKGSFSLKGKDGKNGNLALKGKNGNLNLKGKGTEEGGKSSSLLERIPLIDQITDDSSSGVIMVPVGKKQNATSSGRKKKKEMSRPKSPTQQARETLLPKDPMVEAFKKSQAKEEAEAFKKGQKKGTIKGFIKGLEKGQSKGFQKGESKGLLKGFEKGFEKGSRAASPIASRGASPVSLVKGDISPAAVVSREHSRSRQGSTSPREENKGALRAPIFDPSLTMLQCPSTTRVNNALQQRVEQVNQWKKQLSQSAHQGGMKPFDFVTQPGGLVTDSLAIGSGVLSSTDANRDRNGPTSLAVSPLKVPKFRGFSIVSPAQSPIQSREASFEPAQSKGNAHNMEPTGSLCIQGPSSVDTEKKLSENDGVANTDKKIESIAVRSLANERFRRLDHQQSSNYGIEKPQTRFGDNSTNERIKNVDDDRLNAGLHTLNTANGDASHGTTNSQNGDTANGASRFKRVDNIVITGHHGVSNGNDARNDQPFIITPIGKIQNIMALRPSGYNPAVNRFFSDVKFSLSGNLSPDNSRLGSPKVTMPQLDYQHQSRMSPLGSLSGQQTSVIKPPAGLRSPMGAVKSVSGIRGIKSEIVETLLPKQQGIGQAFEQGSQLHGNQEYPKTYRIALDELRRSANKDHSKMNRQTTDEPASNSTSSKINTNYRIPGAEYASNIANSYTSKKISPKNSPRGNGSPIQIRSPRDQIRSPPRSPREETPRKDLPKWNNSPKASSSSVAFEYSRVSPLSTPRLYDSGVRVTPREKKFDPSPRVVVPARLPKTDAAS